MPSYEKQQIRGVTYGDGTKAYSTPPEIMVCIDCGCAVWPTRMSMHNAWHASIEKLAKAIPAQQYTSPPRRGQAR